MVARVCLALGLVAVLAGNAGAQTSTLMGFVGYPGEVALSKNAVLEVTLEDVTLADAPAVIVATARFPRPSQGSTSFSLPYDATRIARSSTYVVRARIVDGAVTIFISAKPTRVLTQGAGSVANLSLAKPEAVATPAPAEATPVSVPAPKPVSTPVSTTAPAPQPRNDLQRPPLASLSIEPAPKPEPQPEPKSVPKAAPTAPQTSEPAQTTKSVVAAAPKIESKAAPTPAPVAKTEPKPDAKPEPAPATTKPVTSPASTKPTAAPAPTSAAKVPAAPAPVAAPTTIPKTAPAPTPAAKPTTVTAPAATAAPNAKSVSAPAPAPAQPPAAKPGTSSATTPAPTTTPVTKPVAAPAPAPASTAKSSTTPAPTPTPAAKPAPAPSPVATPNPKPAAGPAPKPDMKIEVKPAPAPKTETKTAPARTPEPRNPGTPEPRNSGTVIADLPAFFEGKLPCTDCAGVQYELTLSADASYSLKKTFAGKTPRVEQESGTWGYSSDRVILVLKSNREAWSWFAVRADGALRAIDSRWDSVGVRAPADLLRTASVRAVAPLPPTANASVKSGPVTLPLFDVEWTLTEIDEKPIRPADKTHREIVFVFDSNTKKFSGQSGCNSIDGHFAANWKTLTMTLNEPLRVCRVDQSTERALSRTIKATHTYRIVGTTLDLLDENGARIARFEARRD